jgi:peptidoglycan/LPS O-acetylase OafA/YrhL
MKAEHLKPLTAIRFFAALWVVLYVYWPKLAAASPAFIAKGYLGVEVFFILSGFILCHVYMPSTEDGRFRYGAFIWARLARIYPLHLATLIGIGIMGVAAVAMGITLNHEVLVWGDLPAELLLVHAWGFAKASGWNHASWSISAEWFAYLTFPVFAWTALRSKTRPLLGVAAALAFLGVVYAVYQALTGAPLTEATFYWGALRIVPCFAYGCSLYLLWRSGAADGRIKPLVGTGLSLLALVLSAALGAPDAAVVASGGSLILFLAGMSSSGSRLVSSPVLVWLGEVSYAVYMVCIPWELAFGSGGARLLGFSSEQMPLLPWLVMVLGVLPVGAAAHYLVERPARDLLRKWGRSFTVRGLKSTAA